MKLNPDCVRDLLLEIEQSTDSNKMYSYSPQDEYLKKYEVEKRLCEELNIEYINLSLRTGPSHRFTEKEYQELKSDYAQLFLQLNKLNVEKDQE